MIWQAAEPAGAGAAASLPASDRHARPDAMRRTDLDIDFSATVLMASLPLSDATIYRAANAASHKRPATCFHSPLSCASAIVNRASQATLPRAMSTQRMPD